MNTVFISSSRALRPRHCTIFRAHRLFFPTLLLFVLSISTGAQEAANAQRADAQSAKPTPARDSSSQRPSASKPDAARSLPNTIGSIEGRIVDEGGQPIVNAQVSIIPRGMPNIMRRPASSTTDEDGRFRVNNLDAGVYALWSFALGYVLESSPDPLNPRYYRIGDVANLTMLKGGVITGTVTNANGDPVVAARARALMVRELDGTPPRNGQGFRGFRDFQTDDRGIYRLYGLDPGIYVVSVGGNPQMGFTPPNAYEADAPTYYPSGTRDTAAEITVHAGQETAGIDIHYRGERGHVISGALVGAIDPGGGYGTVNIALLHVPTGAIIGNTFASGLEAEKTFSVEGLNDGDYELVARQQDKDGNAFASQPQRVSIRGADVTGLKLTLTPMASISGALILEPLREAERAKGECVNLQQNLSPREIAIIARRDDRDVKKDQPRSRIQRYDTAPDAQGAFAFRNLDAGRFHIEARALSDDWYLRAVQVPSTASTQAAARPNAPRRSPQANGGNAAPSPALSRESLLVAAAQRLAGVNVTLTEGASSLRGRVVAATAAAEGEVAPMLPPRLRVYLVPVERADADDVLRFAEATVNADGTFALTNLAPGRYRLVARVASIEQAAPENFTRPAAWDAEARADLRREAEATGLALDLQPCQRMQDFTLRYPSANK